MPVTKIKVIDLAKELGVTSKDLMLAAEEMGHKGVRVMTPLDSTLANALRTKLGKGRELPPEEAKPKRAARPKKAEEGEVTDGAVIAKKAAPRVRKAKPEGVEETIELKPTATIVKPKPADKPAEPVAEPVAMAPTPAPIKPVEPVIEPPIAPPIAPPVAPPVEPVRPAAATPSPAPPAPPMPRKPEPKIVPFRPLERSAPPPPRPSRHPSGPFAPPRVTVGPPRPAPPPRPAVERPPVERPAAPAAAAPAPPAAAVAPPRPPERVDRVERVERVERPEPIAPAAVIEAPPPVETRRELVRVGESLTVSELAEKMRRKSGEVIKALLELGVMRMVNDLLDPTEAKLVADKFGFDLEIRSVEGDVIDEEDQDRGIL